MVTWIRLSIVLALFSGAAVLIAQERATLTSPLTHPSDTYCDLSSVTITMNPATISASLVCEQGTTLLKTYNSTTTPTGATLLHSLNIGNFSGATSMIHSVYNRLITDGVIAGTISGTPQ